MKIFGVIFLIFGAIMSVNSLVWYAWWYPKSYEYALQLANDASLPQTKADYLQQYLNRVSTITGPPRYIFTRPDLDLEVQKEILEGLITRFRDIAKLDPREMAYQQGMFQLTGQEVDHQLARISKIFRSAKIRESLFQFLLTWFSWWIFMAVGIVVIIPWDDI